MGNKRSETTRSGKRKASVLADSSDPKDVAMTQSVVVDSQSDNTVAEEAPVTETTEQNQDMTSMTFTKVSTHKNGLTSYSTPGLRGSIYVGKGVFGKDSAPPTTIEISADGLVQPTAEQIERANKRAARKERVSTSLAERAAKAQAKAEKAAANAKKLADRLAKQKPAEGTTEAPAAGNDPAFEAPAVPAETVTA